MNKINPSTFFNDLQQFSYNSYGLLTDVFNNLTINFMKVFATCPGYENTFEHYHSFLNECK